MNMFRYGTIAVMLVILGLGLTAPAGSVEASGEAEASEEAPLEEPDEDVDESQFYARRHLSDTEALELQLESDSDRVERDVLTLDSEEIGDLRSTYRVRVFSDSYPIHKIYREGEEEPYRYAIPLQQPGQHEFMDLMYGIDADGTVHRIDLVVYREPYGGEVASRRFMRQFEDRSLNDSQFRVNLDVIHIAGATISAQSVARGTRKVLGLLRMKGLIPDGS